MLADAARTYVNRFGTLPGKRAVVLTNNDSAYQAALDMADAGIAIAAIVDLRTQLGGPLVAQAKQRGIRILTNSAVTATYGAKRVTGVDVMTINGSAQVRHRCPDQDRLRPRPDVRRLEPRRPPVLPVHRQAALRRRVGLLRAQHLDAGGTLGGSLQGDLHAGRLPGRRSRRRRQAAKAAGYGEGKFPPFPPSRPPSRSSRSARSGWCRQPLWSATARPSISSISRTTYPPPTCCWRPAKATVGRAPEALHHDRHGHRPGQDLQRQRPGDPGEVAGLSDPAGRHHHLPPALYADDLRRVRRPRYRRTGRSARHTPMHSWHVSRNALFEDVGQWKRPWYFPQGAEDMHAAVRPSAACRPHVRRRAGCFDARQDRHPGSRRGAVPEPCLHQRLPQAGSRQVPLRRDVQGRRNGDGRRRDHAPRPQPLPDDHHHRQRRQSLGLA